MATQLSSNLDWSLANPLWASILNPVISNPTNAVQVLQNVNLLSGSNVINHRLGRQMQGWFVTDIQGSATIYRSAPFNNMTLTLTSNSAVTVNIGVF